MPSFQSLSRPLTPVDSRSSSGHSDNGDNSTLKWLSDISLTSGQSSAATSGVDFRFRNVHLGRDDVRRILSKVR